MFPSHNPLYLFAEYENEVTHFNKFYQVDKKQIIDIFVAYLMNFDEKLMSLKVGNYTDLKIYLGFL